MTTIEYILEYWPKETEPRKQGIIRPSLVCHGCPLVCYYDVIGEEALPEEFDFSTRVIMEIGSFLHHTIQKTLSEAYENKGWIYIPEMEAIFNDICRGSCDGVVIDNVGDITAHEYKTCSAAVFDSVRSAPKEYHVKQFKIYMKAVGASKGEIIYICRNDGRMRSFEIEVGGPELDQVVDIINIVEEAVQKGVPPFHKTYWAGSNKCTSTCPYRNKCPEVTKRGVM